MAEVTNTMINCPCCGELSASVERRHRYTAYVDDSMNYLFSCDLCYKEDCDEMEELWRDYYSGRL